MDDLTLIRAFRAEYDDGDPRVRAAAWRELEGRFELGSPSPRLPVRFSGLFFRRRLLFTFAGATAIAAVVAGILVLSSGPTAQPAAAEVLHQTAAVAASGEGAPALQAGPGQYYFTKTRTLEFEGWIPGGLTADAPITSLPGGFSALIPMDSEYWISPDGGSRVRETMGTPHFLSSTEQNRWEEAGSPLPLGFDPRYETLQNQAGSGRHVLELSRGVLDLETPTPKSDPHNYPDLSNIPTDPEELRLAIQSGRAPGISEPGEKPLGTEEVTEDLEGLLSHPNASPALRAATFNALAELPGFELDRDAADLVGRTGYAIGYDKGHGMRGEFIFDPTNSKLLGERTVLADPGKEPQWKGYPAGLTIRDVAYLQSEVVDSTGEPAEESEEQVVTTGPDSGVQPPGGPSHRGMRTERWRNSRR